MARRRSKRKRDASTPGRTEQSLGGDTLNRDDEPLRATDQAPANPAPKSSAPSDESTAAAAVKMSPVAFVAGLACLLLAAVMSAMLVLDHLGGLSLPGCGEGSPCAQAAASVWGTVPYINWPVSFLGFAYFAGALVAWLISRNGPSRPFRYLVRLGALVSLGFVLVIIIEGHHCSYCLASHAGNFGFWVFVELARRPTSASGRPLVSLTAVFILASAIMGIAALRARQEMTAQQEAELADSIATISAADAQRTPDHTPPTHANADANTSGAATASGGSENPPRTIDAGHASETSAASAPTGDATKPRGFTGRWRQGSEAAPVRVVMLTDYQCVDCNRIEKEVRKMMSERTDVSLSIKHFPMCIDCNDSLAGSNMHPNACWAARAAEAAGILRGNDGFWQMHEWLFDRGGGFSHEELTAGLREMGYDPDAFVQVMTSDETLQRVKEDIAEGVALGLQYTPMAFINGQELRGVFAPNAIPRAVAAVAAQNPPPRTAEDDHPPPAVEKYIGDWRAEPKRRLPADQHSWARGPEDAKVQIIAWGDYLEPGTAQADATIRKYLAQHDDVRYDFRHFPFNQRCNPAVSRTVFESSCRAAQAVEAAGLLGGSDAHWKMHDWMMTHQKEFNDETLRRAATEIGLDPDALFAKMSDPEVQIAIEEDCRAGKPVLYRGRIPSVHVNGQVIPRLSLGKHRIMERIFDEAAGRPQSDGAPAPSD